MLLIMPLGMSKTVINVARWPGMRSPPVRSTPCSMHHAPCTTLHAPWPSAFQQVCSDRRTSDDRGQMQVNPQVRP